MFLNRYGVGWENEENDSLKIERQIVRVDEVNQAVSIYIHISNSEAFNVLDTDKLKALKYVIKHDLKSVQP